MSDAASVTTGAPDRRWLILGVIGLAQLMVILDLTVMNIALPSAQRALHFTTPDRQWVVTAYTLAFGSLLLLGGRLADLLGRKVTFLIGLVGFAGVSAIGGASVNFAMLVTARACQGAFAALLVPSALSLLTTTFTEPKDRSRAFAVYGAIAAAGGAVGLLLGGALTEYLSWRWCLYVNLVFAGVAFIGGALLLARQPSPVKPRLDVPGALLVSGAVFCLVYGFSNAAAHSWHAPSTYGFLAAGVVLLAVFAWWQGRAAHPLLPPRVVLDRNRGGAYLSFFIAAAGMFGIFLFLTYYLQQTLGYSPLVTGLAFLPWSGCLIVMSNLSTIVLMPRVGPRPLVASGMLASSGGMAWLAQLGQHTGYAAGVLGPLILAGIGLGLVIAPVINTGTFGVAPQDAGVASATVTVGQMLGGSVGTSLLNSIFAGAVASYLAAHLALGRLIGRQALDGLALAHGYDTGFWWIAGIFAAGAVVSGALLRPGPLYRTGTPPEAVGALTAAQTQTGPGDPDPRSDSAPRSARADFLRKPRHERQTTMTISDSTVAIIGTGNIGSRLAANFAAGGQDFLLAGQDADAARKIAADLGGHAEVVSVDEAVDRGDVLVFAVWLPAFEQLIAQYGERLAGKVIVDPTNAIEPDGKGGVRKTIGEKESSGQILAGLLPAGARLVKAFGTLSAPTLSAAAWREPERAVQFYAADDEAAGDLVAELIRADGFDPVRVGGLDQSIRIEMLGDLHEFGGLGRTVTRSEALAAI